MESSDRRGRSDRSRSLSSTREPPGGKPRALSFSRSPSPRSHRSRRTRSRGRSSSSSLSSRSSSSRSRSRRRRSSGSRRSDKHAAQDKRRGSSGGSALAALKSTAPLLATIGVASIVAHKFWPKGVLFGDKEEWETRKVVDRRANTLVTDRDGGLRRVRSVRQRGDGDVVVDELVRRERSVGERHGRRGVQRPVSAYFEDDRRHTRPPGPPHDRREGRYLDDGYQPRHGDRYHDPDYDGRAHRQRDYVDDRGYDDRRPRRW